MLVRATKTASETVDDERRAAFEAKFPGVMISPPAAGGPRRMGVLAGYAPAPPRHALALSRSSIVVVRPAAAPRPRLVPVAHRPPSAPATHRAPSDPRGAVRILTRRELGALSAFAARLNKKRARA